MAQVGALKTLSRVGCHFSNHK